MKGVAAQKASDSHGRPPENSIFLNGLSHILRARRMKAAGGRQGWGNPSLIQTKSTHHQVLYYSGPHLSITLRSARSISEKGASRAARRGLTTISHCAPNSARWRRKASRKRRLRRLRTTAPPMARGTVRPKRALGLPEPVCARQNAANKGPERRKPLS